MYICVLFFFYCIAVSIVAFFYCTESIFLLFSIWHGCTEAITKFHRTLLVLGNDNKDLFYSTYLTSNKNASTATPAGSPEA